MHTVALKSLPQSGEHKMEWQKLPEDQQTWAAWKTTFWEAYIAKRRSEAAQEGREIPLAVTQYSVLKQRRQQTHTYVRHELPRHELM